MQDIRLKKVATEMNVGISTIVEFLAKKGHWVELNPNTRLTTEQYGLVASAFQGERAVKEQVDKIEITPSGSNVVIEANTDEKKDETDEVIFKPTQVGDLRIISKIDLDAINSRMRPNKKKKTKAEKTTYTKGSSKTAETAAEPKSESQTDSTLAPAKPEPEFSKAQYTKFEGPRLVGMVDLSQFEKPKPSSSEKKKRKRIKNKGLKVSDTTGESERTSAPTSGKSSSMERKADIDAMSEKDENSDERKHQSLDEMRYIDSQNPIQKQPIKSTQIIKQDSILQNKKGRDIFISYSRDDKAIVFPFVKQIEQNLGVQCWIDLTGIKSGEEFEEVIINAIDECKIVLFMLSDNSLKSKWTKREVYYAEDEGKRIVPILVDGEKLRGWFKFHFGNVDYIDIQSDEQKNKLIGNLKTWLEMAESEL